MGSASEQSIYWLEPFPPQTSGEPSDREQPVTPADRARMPTGIDDSLIHRVTETIVTRLKPRRVVLFGSRASGIASDDSDLAIEVSELFGLRTWPLDVVVYTPQEVARLRGIRGTLLSTIEAQGRVLMSGPDANHGAWLEKAENDLLNIQNNLRPIESLGIRFAFTRNGPPKRC